MPTLTANGTEIAYDQAGAGQPLLLVHAGIVDRRMWDPVWDALAVRFRVIRPDLRGFGETPKPDGGYAHWRDLAELLRSLEAVPAHVVGVSMGASAALDLALAEPELVDRLVLVAPGLGGWEWSAGLRAEWDAEEVAWQSGDLDQVAWINVRTWLDGPMRGGEAPAGLRRTVFDMQRHALDLDNDAAVVVPLEPPARERLGEVRAPTLVVVGDLDQPDMMAIGEHIAASIPGARLTVMLGVAHLPPMEAPEAFVALVEEFLAESAEGAEP
jgi:3-oxoadipate enol-lactonase